MVQRGTFEEWQENNSSRNLLWLTDFYLPQKINSSLSEKMRYQPLSSVYTYFWGLMNAVLLSSPTQIHYFSFHVCKFIYMLYMLNAGQWSFIVIHRSSGAPRFTSKANYEIRKTSNQVGVISKCFPRWIFGVNSNGLLEFQWVSKGFSRNVLPHPPDCQKHLFNLLLNLKITWWFDRP